MGWGQPHAATGGTEPRDDIQPRQVANLIDSVVACGDGRVAGVDADVIVTLARSWQRQRRKIASLNRVLSQFDMEDQ